jgi:hypothetical protein
LIGQCISVGWQYISVKIPTWSSDPFDTAEAMVWFKIAFIDISSAKIDSVVGSTVDPATGYPDTP